MVFGDLFGTVKKGLFGAGPSKSSLDMKTANLDSGSQSILDREMSEGGMSAEDIANRELEGAQDATRAGLADYDKNQGYLRQSLGGPQDKALSEAIGRKYARTAERDLNELTRTTKLNAQLKRAQRLNQRSQVMQKEADYKFKVNQAQIQVEQNKANARASVISSIFGAAGAIGGFALSGGNPQAGMAGQQAGTGLSGIGNTQSQTVGGSKGGV